MTTEQGRAVPTRVYTRRDPEVDPPGIAIGLDLAQHMTDGSAVLFVDHEAEPSRLFELHRIGGAFRLSDGLSAPRGVFASPEAAIRAGWAAVDAGAARLAENLPALDELLTGAEPTEEGA